MSKTHYNGINYDNRTQARWAVFFDAMGLDFEYNPAIDLDAYLDKFKEKHKDIDCSDESYKYYKEIMLRGKWIFNKKPTFYLPRINEYAIVTEFNPDYEYIYAFKTIVNKDIILLDGVPDIKTYASSDYEYLGFCTGALYKWNQLYVCPEKHISEDSILEYDELVENVHASRSARFENF